MDKDNYIFKNQNKTVSGMVKLILGMAILGIILGLIIVMVKEKVQGDFVYLFMASRIYALVIFVALVAIAIFISVDYMVDKQGVQFIRRGKVIKSFPFENHNFDSHISQTIDLSSGISTKKRFLLVDDGNKQKKLPINLSKKEYDIFMSVVSNYKHKHATSQNNGNEV